MRGLTGREALHGLLENPGRARVLVGIERLLALFEQAGFGGFLGEYRGSEREHDNAQ